jgi:hypothetical protein
MSGVATWDVMALHPQRQEPRLIPYSVVREYCGCPESLPLVFQREHSVVVDRKNRSCVSVVDDNRCNYL